MESSSDITKLDEKVQYNTGNETANPDIIQDEDSHDFFIDGGKVTVYWKRFTPHSTPALEAHTNSARPIFFIPGWGYRQDSTPSCVLTQAYADNSNETAYAIDMYTHPGATYSAIREAEAAREFILSTGVKECILVGQSHGGVPAIYVTAMLPMVKGLILIDSMGMVTRPLGRFLIDYLIESLNSGLFIQYPKNSARYDPEAIKATNKAYLQEGVEEISRQLMLADGLLPFAERLYGEIRSMIQRSNHACNVKVPVILINGDKDKLSKPGMLIPARSDRPKHSSNRHKRRYLRTMSEREEYLKYSIFQSSPHIRMLVANKLGYHGLLGFRPDAVARTSLDQLRRCEHSLNNLG